MEVGRGRSRKTACQSIRLGLSVESRVGNGTTRSPAYTERSSQPAHQYSSRRSGSRLQRGRRNKVGEVKLFTDGGRVGEGQRAPAIKECRFLHSKKKKKWKQREQTKEMTPPVLRGAAEGATTTIDSSRLISSLVCTFRAVIHVCTSDTAVCFPWVTKGGAWNACDGKEARRPKRRRDVEGTNQEEAL